jgi:2,4-dienoyl-CoA reductase-like NADH-dependent reductase (Old Yellow Enzyme family)
MINTELKLPCGATIKNRLVKAAMTERIADRYNEPVVGHERLYDKWAKTDAGLLITGNVIVDRKHLESSGNVCFDNENVLPKIEKWANAAVKNGNHVWVQISHAGRQANRFSTSRPKAPSEVQLKKLGLLVNQNQ